MNARHAKNPVLRLNVPVLRAFEAAARSGMLKLYAREGLEFALRSAGEKAAELKAASESRDLSRAEKLLQGRMFKLQNAVNAVLADGPMP